MGLLFLRVSSSQLLARGPQHQPALLLLWVTEVERNQLSFAKLLVNVFGVLQLSLSHPSWSVVSCFHFYALG